MSLLDEAKELIEMSLTTGSKDSEYARKAQLWLAKTSEAQKAHQGHHHEEGASCSLCGFDLACPSCGN
jgi:hypothetical protein